MFNRLHILLGVILLFLTGSVFAQDSTRIEDDYVADTDDMRFILSPYAWLAGQATDVGGEKIRQSFNDVASLTNFGFQLNASLWYKKWILTADGTYAHLKAGVDEGILLVDANIKQYILDLKLGYLVYSNIFKQREKIVRGWAMEVNTGAKHWKNDVNIDYKVMAGEDPILEGSIVEPQAWWDLMIGVKARIFLSEYVLLGLSADGGGFGMGNSSNFSWDFTYVNTFKVSDLISVTAGYRSFQYTREDGEGDEKLKTRVSAFGPLLGLSFVF